VPTDLRLEFIDAIAVGHDWCIYKRHGTRVRAIVVESHLGGCFAGHEDSGDSSAATPRGDAEQYTLLRDGKAEEATGGHWNYEFPGTLPFTFRRRTVEWRLFSGNRLLAAREVQLIPGPIRLAQLVFLAIAAPALAWLAWLLAQLPSGDSASVLHAASLVLGTGLGGWMLSARGLALSPKSPPLLWLGLPLATTAGLLLFQWQTTVVANATPSPLSVASDGNQVLVAPGTERLLLAPRLLSSEEERDLLCLVPRKTPLIRKAASVAPPTPANRYAVPLVKRSCQPQVPVIPKSLFGWLPRKTISCLRATLFHNRLEANAPCESLQQQRDSTELAAAFRLATGKQPDHVPQGVLTLRPREVRPGRSLVNGIIHNDAETVSMDSADPLGEARFVAPRRAPDQAALQVILPQIETSGAVAFRVGAGEAGADSALLGHLRCTFGPSSEKHPVEVWLRPMSSLVQRIVTMDGSRWLSEWNVVAQGRLAPAAFCATGMSVGTRTIQFELSAPFSHRPNDVVNLPRDLGPIERVQIVVGGEWHGDIEVGTPEAKDRIPATDLSLRAFRVSGLTHRLSVLAIGGIPIPSYGGAAFASMSSIWRAENRAPGDWAWALIPSEFPSPDKTGTSKVELSAIDRVQRRYVASDKTSDTAALTRHGLLQLTPERGRRCRVARNSNVELKAGVCHRQDPKLPQDSEWILERGAAWALAGCDLARLEICE
jgi:hypothetical protein